MKTSLSVPDEAKQSPKLLSLAEVSPKDKPWDDHRAAAEKVEGLYAGSDFDRYAQRMGDCSRRLDFELRAKEDDTIGLKLRAASFCRVRNCPVCQWRRSLSWKAKAHELLPRVTAAYPSHRWLFLTLTVKNCPVDELKETIKRMNKGWRYLTEWAEFPAVGWLKSVEVTRGVLGDAHPHFHVLLVVPAGYFSDRYLSQQDWRDKWQKVMKLDYQPQVNVKAIKKGSNPTEIVPEILKYSTKESDLTTDKDWLVAITTQLHKTKAITTGGILKEYLRTLEDEPEDLIGADNEAEGEDYGGVRFGWQTKDKHYRMVD